MCKNFKSMSFWKNLGIFVMIESNIFLCARQHGWIFFVQNRFLLFYTSSQLNTHMASSSIQAKKKKLKRETIFHAVRQFSWMENWFNNVILRIRAKNFFLFSVPKNKLKLLCPSIVVVWCYFYLICILTTYPVCNAPLLDNAPNYPVMWISQKKN